MTIMRDFGDVSAPHHPRDEFLPHDAEARTALASLFNSLLERLVLAGWDWRMAASALMFHAATQVSGLSKNGLTQ